jgi:hypothetical protein
MRISRKFLVGALLAILGMVCPVRALTYEDWIASYGLTGADAEPLADPDNDGHKNITEFIFANGNPTAGTILVQRVMWGQRTGNALPITDPSVITEVANPNALTHAHAGVEWSPRAGIEGVRVLPEYSRINSGLYSWYSGRNAVIIREKPGDSTKLQAWSLELTARPLLTRFFWRIRVKTIE